MTVIVLAHKCPICKREQYAEGICKVCKSRGDVPQLEDKRLMLLPLTRGAYAIVDSDLSEETANRKWFLTREGYVARTQVAGTTNTRVYLHREILGSPVGMLIDHIDGNRLNNSRANLRVATPKQNNFNRGAVKGKYKGVYFNKTNKKWIAQVTINSKRVYIGSFNSEIEAAKAYDDEARKIQGSFVRPNLQDSAERGA